MQITRRQAADFLCLSIRQVSRLMSTNALGRIDYRESDGTALIDADAVSSYAGRPYNGPAADPPSGGLGVGDTMMITNTELNDMLAEAIRQRDDQWRHWNNSPNARRQYPDAPPILTYGEDQ